MPRAAIAEARAFQSWQDEQEELPILQTICGLLDHDLPHAGELSLLLGASGLPGVEI
jgi:hypothetical protein